MFALPCAPCELATSFEVRFLPAGQRGGAGPDRAGASTGVVDSELVDGLSLRYIDEFTWRRRFVAVRRELSGRFPLHDQSRVQGCAMVGELWYRLSAT